MAHRKSAERRAKAARIARFETLAASKTAAAPHPKAGWRELAELERRFTGTIVLPSDPSYDADRQESNPAFQAYPQVIVYCRSEYDVVQCIQWAQQYGIWVAVRSGGHSTAGYSVNDGMVIDVSKMNSVILNEPEQLVYVGAGCDFDHFNAQMASTGWHVPTGACGSVCVGGFVQGGGYGYTSRNFGIQCDSVVNFRVALADGSVVNANADQNSDLYWAMRGGTGGNFGILLQVTYRMVPLASVWAFAVQWDPAYGAQVLQLQQQQFMLDGPPQLGYMMNLGYYPTSPVTMVQGMYCGSAEDGKAAIESWLAIPTAQLLVDQTGSYPAMDVYLEDHPYSLPYDLPDGACETKASCYIGSMLAQSDWQRIVDYFSTSPNPYSLAYTEPYGGAINAYPVGDSAFIHRSAYCDFVADVFWTNPDEQAQMTAWLDGLMALVLPFSNGEVYQNYCDARLANWQQAYFGSAYPQLQQVKAAYDPGNFFRYQQSIALP